MLFRIFASVFFVLFAASAFGSYKYELVEENGSRIHVVTIDPVEYEVSLIAAHNQVFGRERVGSIAKRENAQIAINAGFFEIGDVQDGRPTGTMVSDGSVFGMRTSEHGCFVKKGNKYAVEILKPSLEITLGKKQFKIAKFNRSASGKNIFYFNRNWGPSSLSDYSNRKEIILDGSLKVLEIALHGNNKIPNNGYVISFPKKMDIEHIKVGQIAKFNWIPEYFQEKDNFAIMGIPPLIMNNKIREGLSNEQKHARTAIGIKDDGKLVMVVAEHVYSRSVSAVTIHEIRKIMEKKKLSFSDMSVSDMKKIILDDLSSKNTAVGLTTLELAKFMHQRGCSSAINLDGGGSSTLYIDGKYINESIGDIDEAAGQSVVRPVSDAIVFRKI